MSMMALAQQLQSQGRGNDTILAHINPEEAAMLEAAGGAGTLNPNTGLPEFGWLDDLWNGVKKVWNNTVQPLVRKLAPVIIPAVSIFFPAAIPAIGAWFGATGTAAAVVGTAALSAGVTLAAGGTIEQAIKGAALGAAASYITPIIGAKANELLGAQLSPAVQSYLGSAIVSGGIAAARGQSVRDVFKAAATGAATAYLGSLAKNYYQKINDQIETGRLNIGQKTADASLVTAADAETYKKAGLSEQQIAASLRAQGVSTEHANLAAKSIVANNSAEQTAVILAEYSGKSGSSVMNATLGKDAIANSVTLGNNADILLRAEDASFLAQDAVQLKNQGLNAAQIQQHLEASGATPVYARTAAQMAVSGSDTTAIATKIQSSAQYNSSSSYTSSAAGGQVYNNTDYVVPREIGQVMTGEQQTLADSIPYRDMVTAGTITVDQAATYKDAGYQPADVTKLMSVGYNATDLQDLAAVGVNARDLVTLSNTKFAESQINDLMAGGASVFDIATTSRVIDTGRLDVTTASQLLSRDITANSISQLVARGQAQAAANSTLSGTAINKLATGGWDINRAAQLQAEGQDVNGMVERDEWNLYRNISATAATTAPVSTATPADPTTALVNSGALTTEQVTDLTGSGYSKADISTLVLKGYTAPDLMDLAAAGVPANTLVSLSNTQFPESQINDFFAAGATANDIATASNIANTGKITVDTAGKLLSKDMTGSQINSLVYNQPNAVEAVANSTLTNSTVNRLLDGGFDLSKATQLQNSGVDVNNLIATNNFAEYRAASAAPPGTVMVRDASGRIGYFEAATGNTLDAQGNIIQQRVQPEIGPGTETAGVDTRVEITGRPGKVGSESAVRGPLTPGTTLATDEDIDAGRATFNTESNAWEVPVSEYTYTTPPGEVVGPPAPVPTEPVPGGDYKYVSPFDEAAPPAPAPTAPTPPAPTPPAPPVVAPPVVTPPSDVVAPPAPPVVAPPSDVVAPVTPPSVTVPGQTDDGTIVVTAPREPEIVIPPTPLVPPEPAPPPAPAPAPAPTPAPVPTPAPEPTTPTPAPVEVITPTTPYVPVPTPPVPEDTPRRGFGNVDRLPIPDFGSLPGPGLNPGFVQPQPYYAVQNPVQSQYYYGERPYQPGPTFNQALYDQVPAPVVPFGLQQMYTPIDLNAYLNQFTQSIQPVAPR